MTKTQIAGAKKIPGAKIAAWTNDREFVLNHRFSHRDDAKLHETLTKIRAAGSIDLSFWRPARPGEL